MSINEKKQEASGLTTISNSCNPSFSSFYKGDGEVWYGKAASFLSRYNFDLITSTKEFNNNELVIYPNPIQIGKEIKVQGLAINTPITVYNSLGQKISIIGA